MYTSCISFPFVHSSPSLLFFFFFFLLYMVVVISYLNTHSPYEDEVTLLASILSENQAYSITNSTGNYSVMDLITAFEWVRQEWITVGSQSSSSAYALDTFYSSLSSGLIHGVIVNFLFLARPAILEPYPPFRHSKAPPGSPKHSAAPYSSVTVFSYSC